jgi:hypothetical protein
MMETTGRSLVGLPLGPALFAWTAALPFALAAAAFLAGRLGLVAVAAALAAGIGLQLAYPASFAYGGGAGPAYPVWIGFVGGGAALVVAALTRREPVRAAQPEWAVAVLAALVLPVAVAGFRDLRTENPLDRYALTPGLVDALRGLPPGAVVFANLETAYRAAAYAPVYVAAAPPAHVARTTANRPYERRADVVRFFDRPEVSDARRLAILRSYDAGWLLVDRSRRYPRVLVAGLAPVYRDARYSLFRVPTA